MRLLAFTDLHASITSLKALERKAKQADLIACLGDFTIFEQNIEPVLERIANLGKRVLLIHGNHETAAIVERLSRKHKSIRFIHRKTYTHEGYTFLGWGGGGFALEDERFARWARTLDLTEAKAVLLTHQPPYGTKLDALHEHVGNKSFAAFIRRNPAVVLALSGHIHETFGKEDKLGKARLVNPGPAGTFITLP
jgi:Icc-related predicted phosphoesterase